MRGTRRCCGRWMRLVVEAIAFPDVEALNVSFLSDRLGESVWVSTNVPTVRPPLAVKVTRVGGVRRNLVTDAPMVMFECWANSGDLIADEIAASDLARRARAHVGSLDDTAGSRVGLAHRREVGGPAFNPDPDSDAPRYSFTVEQSARGTAI